MLDATVCLMYPSTLTVQPTLDYEGDSSDPIRSRPSVLYLDDSYFINATVMHLSGYFIIFATMLHLNKWFLGTALVVPMKELEPNAAQMDHYSPA